MNHPWRYLARHLVGWFIVVVIVLNQSPFPLKWDRLWPLLPLWALGFLAVWLLAKKKRNR
jgi:hypothetical protein